MGPLLKDTSGFMVFPAVALLILGSSHRASSESHSLSLFATFIYGETPFPEFTMVLTVNNVPVEYYDSNIKKIVSRRHWKHIDSENTESKYFVVENVHRVLKIDSHRLMKHFNHTNERPRIRVIQKRDPGTGGSQVCCLATGFFPRHINMTLLRDGQPVPEQDLTGGEVLPNGDGTFQMRKSLSVSEQQFREKYRYTCTVTHLDRKEDSGLEPEGHPGVIFIPVLAVIVLVLIVLVAAVFLYRRHIGPPDPCQTSAPVRYTAAQKTEQSDSTSISSSS